MMVEALTGLLVGGVFGPHVRPMYAQLETYRNLSSFHLVIDPTIFIGENVYATAQQMIDELHAQQPAPGFEGVKLPGEIEAQTMKESLIKGISIPKTIYDFLSQE